MKVCIPIAFKPEGGGQYFLQQFRGFLEAHGHGTTDRVTDRCDVLFTNHWLVSMADILRAIRRNPRLRLVQRIDGSATDYGRTGDADQRQHEVNQIADLTIFQSEYCRWSTRQKFPVILQDGPVIHNPVDLDRFTPAGGRETLTGSTRVVAVSWSTNPRKGAAHVYGLARHYPGVDFYLCGRFLDAPALANVHALGVLDRDRLPVILRSCHALVTFSENEACPNHVLEALASGLPVLYGDSGAMCEVIGDGGLAVTPGSFAARLADLAADWPRWSAVARQRAERHFNPAEVYPRYVAAIEGAVARPPRMAMVPRLLMAFGGRASALSFRWRRWDRARPAGASL